MRNKNKRFIIIKKRFLKRLPKLKLIFLRIYMNNHILLP